MTKFTSAIVRQPGKSIINGISGSDSGVPNHSKALMQHDKYIKALIKCGLDVTVLEPDEEFPDSVFTEDVALLTKRCAIITRPGAESRRDEVKGIRNTIEKYYSTVEEIVYPGTIEAGDIMMVRDHFYIGLSNRTNLTGAEQMLTILQKHGFTGSTLSLEKVLHLKTGVSYLEENSMLVCGEFTDTKEFTGFNKIVVPGNESYAANSVWINGNVLTPKGFPKTATAIEKMGYNIIELDVSEFRKLDGGLSCLSLRF